MLTLYTNATPNGHRAAIMLEETGVPYRVSVVDLAAGKHKTPEFRAINATGRIPAIVDEDAPGGPLALAETLAIALYLCEKSRRLMPQTLPERARAWQWAATVISGFGAATPIAEFGGDRRPPVEAARLGGPTAFGREANEKHHFP